MWTVCYDLLKCLGNDFHCACMSATESCTEIIEQQKANGNVETANSQPDGVEFYIPHKSVVENNQGTNRV